MPARPKTAPALTVLLAAALLAACAPKDDAPARKAIDQIDTAIKAAGPDATKYLPGHVSAVNAAVTQLKVRYYDRDYAAILKDAPGVLARAQELGPQAAAKKAQFASALSGEWAALETGVPAAIEALRKRAGELNAAAPPPGVNVTILQAIPASIEQQQKLWDQALAAKAAGNIEQAVTIGVHVKRRADVLLNALNGGNG